MRVKNDYKDVGLPFEAAGKQFQVYFKVRTGFFWRIYNWLTNPLRYIFFGVRRW